MIERIMRVIQLDKSVFAEVEHDQSATGQAAMVVALVALLSAIGSGVGALIGPSESKVVALIAAFLSAILSSFLGWLVWSAVTYFVGTSLFKGEADLNEMLRVIGFAQAPLLLRVFNFIPCVGWIIGFVGWALSLYTGYLAVQEGLDLEPTETIITIVIGWVAAMIVGGIIGLIMGIIFGVSAAGMSAFSDLLGQGGWLL